MKYSVSSKGATVKIPKDGVTECYDNSWCPENEGCINNICIENLINYYRFENNQCFLIELYQDQVTDNDYEILIECKQNVIIEPPQPELSEIELFFINIWDWIKGLF